MECTVSETTIQLIALLCTDGCLGAKGVIEACLGAECHWLETNDDDIPASTFISTISRPVDVQRVASVLCSESSMNVCTVNGCVTTDNRVPTLKTEPLADCTLDSGRMLNIALSFGISIFVLVYASATYRLA